MARRSSCRVDQRCRSRTFFCSSAKNESIAALSDAPTRPIDPVSPLVFRDRTKALERNWPENEYQYVIQGSEEYENGSLGESLVSIVRSQDFPSTERSALRCRLATAGLTDVSVAQPTWIDGAPQTVLRYLGEHPSLPPAELT